MKVVSILSGGLDSAVATAIALAAGFSVEAAVTFVYGQRHAREVASAHKVAAFYRIPHFQVIELPHTPFAMSALTAGEALPQDRTPAEMLQGMAPTYVPNRNMVLISVAGALAYTYGATALVGGWHWDDSSGYPDCREAFLQAAEAALRLGLDQTDFQLLRPLIRMGKAAIIQEGLRLNAPLHLTWSCYAGGETPCGHCDSCILRAAGFAAAGVSDPALS